MNRQTRPNGPHLDGALPAIGDRQLAAAKLGNDCPHDPYPGAFTYPRRVTVTAIDSRMGDA